MNCLNRIQLIGHLGKEPELKNLNSGHLVCTLKLATSEAFKDKEGKWQQNTQWHTLILWGKIAEYAAQHIRKGEKLYAEGKLQYRTYTTLEQGRKTVAEILIDQVFTLEKKKPSNEKFASKEGETSDLPW
ncbi:MAG: single-stranded DNA-binding protein [Bacteroidota bacterium]|jgi:single-strand DNA-binding protein